MPRRILILALMSAILCPIDIFAAVPSVLNLQGRLTDASGNPVTTTTQVDFFLYQGGSPDRADDGTVVYKERAVITPGPDGTYQHLIGSGTPLEGHTLTVSDFDTAQDVFLQINIGGASLLPRLKFASNAYAYLAGKANDISDNTISLSKLQPDVSGFLVPTGMIAMFASSCPNGWSRFNLLDGRFPLGSASYTGVPAGSSAITGLVTGLAGAHVHGPGTLQASGSVPIAPIQWASGGTSKSVNQITSLTLPVVNGQTASGGDHVHSVISDGSWLPPYLGVVYCQKN